MNRAAAVAPEMETPPPAKTDDAAVHALLDNVLRKRAAAIAAEPGVPRTLRIGGTGRRRIDAKHMDALNATLAGVFDCLRTAAGRDVSGAMAELFVITPLAEGADRIIANTALACGLKIGAILPFEHKDYEATFDLAADPRPAIDAFRKLLSEAALPNGYGVLTLDGDASPQAQTKSYRECAAVLAEWSDLLITIIEEDHWDSETGLAARAAIERGMPAIIIDPLSPGEFRLAIAGDILGRAQSGFDALEALVTRLVASEKEKAGRRSMHGFAAFRDELVSLAPHLSSDYEYAGPYRIRTVAPWWLRWFSGLNGALTRAGRYPFLFRRKRAPQAKETPMAWSLPFDRDAAVPFVDLFLRYHRADIAANAYAALHRSGQIVTVFLGLAIVVVGIADSQLRSLPLTALELVLLVYVWLLVSAARRQCWLERWVEYRLVAEILRSAKFLSLSGHSALFAGTEMARAASDASRNWTFGYCRDVLRDLRLAMPGRGLDTEPSARSRVVGYLSNQCIGAQISYHLKTARVRDSVNELLRWLAVSLGVATFLIVAGKFLVGIIERFEIPLGNSEALLNLIEMLLPALAGALLALRASGEHSIVVRRSKALLLALELEKRRLEATTNIFRLQRQLASAVSAQLRDVDGWFELFSDKPIEM